jgi:hypothetical protein
MIIDLSTFYVTLHRIWQMLAGGITLLFIPYWLSKEQQGYYFTFNSIIALQLIFELGLSQVILQRLGTAHAQENSGARHAELDTGRRYEVGALVQFFKRWYLYVAVCFFIFSSLAGLVFLHFFSQQATGYSLLLCTLLACASVVLYQAVYLGMLEACGEIHRVAKLRFIQSCIAYSMLWGGALIVPHLWWMIMPVLISALTTGLWLTMEKKNTGSKLFALLTKTYQSPIVWLRDVWPFQWRIALSWFSGYLITQLFVPVTFSIYGAVEAGQLGITLALYGAVFTISYSLIAAKAPLIVQLIAHHEHSRAFSLFARQLKYTLSLGILGCLSLLVLQIFLSGAIHPYADRISTHQVFYALTASTLSGCITSSCATFLRAYGEEPMLKPSVVQAAMSLILLSQAHLLSIQHLLTLHSMICCFVVLPWTLYLIKRQRSVAA